MEARVGFLNTEFAFDPECTVRNSSMETDKRAKATTANAFSTAASYAFCSNFRSLSVTEEYRTGSLRGGGSIEDDDAYLGDEFESKDGYEDSSSNSDFQPKVRYTFTFCIFLPAVMSTRIHIAPVPFHVS